MHRGKGLLVAGLLLLAVEVGLHQDAVLHRLRSVFAAGRALDKVLYVKTEVPDLVIMGNSRADNGFDPRTVAKWMGNAAPLHPFNLGIPGADARVLVGILIDCDRAGILGGDGVQAVVLSLDEALLQDVDTLGQEVFFADRRMMLRDGEYVDFVRSVVRLYGYSANIRQLREPATLQRFIAALHADNEPIGGRAAARLGYRPGFGALQAPEAVLRQEAGSGAPPSERNLNSFWRAIDLLERRSVKIAIVFPPLLNRNVGYIVTGTSDAVPYNKVRVELARRGIPLIVLDERLPKNPAEFVNAGHLNDRGAQRYSAMLGQALARVWSPAASP
jgi:hypothetical protein